MPASMLRLGTDGSLPNLYGKTLTQRSKTTLNHVIRAWQGQIHTQVLSTELG